ncbi:MAG: ATP-binding protein [Planctomycetaceae bacterium]
MHSLRRRLILLLSGGFAILLALAGVDLAGRVRERVTEEFDEALLAKVQALVALTEEENGRIELDYVPSAMPEFERAEAPDYFQFWLDDGTVLLRSRHLQGDLPRRDLPLDQPTVADAPLPDGRSGRVATWFFLPHHVGGPDDPEEASAPPASPGERRGVVLAVGRGRERLDRLLAGIHAAILGVGGGAVLVGALFVWRAMVSGFRPIDAIAAQVARLDAENLEARIAVPRMPRELASVVGQMNALLDRLHASFERERRFTASVAHELRTPISELRSLAQVGATWPKDEAATVRYFEDVDEIASQMDAVIADLLLLARCQAGVEAVASVPADLRELVASSWAKLAPRAQDRGLALRLEMPPSLVIASDPGKLAIVFNNVLGNAVCYARPRSEILLRGSAEGDAFLIDVANSADPLSREELERLTEPFWRKDDARSEPGHAGLGLSVVSALVALLGLQVTFDQDRDGIFRVRLKRGLLGRPIPYTGGVPPAGAT